MAGFTKIAEVEASEADIVEHPAKRENVALQMLLAAISQKVGALAQGIFSLLTVGSCWWLWMQTPHDPSDKQLVGLGMYGAFILALHVIRGRQK